jgi:PadR family transcriptional regulator PadR
MYQNQEQEIEKKVTQLRKGILELAIMSALYRDTHYGYSLVREMTAAGVFNLKEGTIYPILSRLAKEGLVETEWVESKQGPPRKYYALTGTGRTMCEALMVEFRRLIKVVEAAETDTESLSMHEVDKKIIVPRKENG